MKLLISTTVALKIATLIGTVHGHGYMFEPLSRNYFAHLYGLSYGNEPGLPPAEYCQHCLNTKGPGSVCGTSEQGINYDDWLDISGQPMPWNNNCNVYREGDVITISSYLVSHHTGHMEVRACPEGRASTQECFDANVLEFVEDLNYGMPKDDNYPERGYYYGDDQFSNNEFSMRFKLPDGFYGDEVLFQWLYVTANSCYPPGYIDYYEMNSELPKFYNTEVQECTPEQYTESYFTGDWPERFVNCAEVRIVPADYDGGISSNCSVNGSDNDDDNSNNNPAPTSAPPLSTQPPITNEDIPDIAPPAPSEDESDDGEDVGDNEGGCCSNDYKTCATFCQEGGRDQCESSACVNMKWLADGPLPSSETCAARWEGCTDTGTAGCCDGLVCKGSSPYWKMCLAPDDAAPN
mmetsp:Transcript_6238/g.15433  ORF Transcript_6238/g.15433 Transcript_6238/m.15433 type:complete len:407 (+) Transcript_6238:74-1294(+)|eukprot:CAMPEP_0197183460 /NCGR_PEP_ID=MMETSP1423-20130617/7830_1 /TAXON_ID=476441 /ORGANISM="Pseudo-nitzschia heimii, Strain UNC1101" /LENGTH=406 /DNA_ID=CAMNT_0042634043 /DNA_START=29 /DNA_END=1249 /DNA_ORIENTATION=-